MSGSRCHRRPGATCLDLPGDCVQASHLRSSQPLSAAALRALGGLTALAGSLRTLDLSYLSYPGGEGGGGRAGGWAGLKAVPAPCLRAHRRGADSDLARNWHDSLAC